MATDKPTSALAPTGDLQVSKTPVKFGVAPTSLDEGWRLAQMMAKSELVPKAFRGHPEDVLVAVQMGTEIGFAPMQALQSIAVINGRPGVWGDGLLALIMSSPLYQDHDEYYEVDGHRRDRLLADDLKKDATEAVCTFWRKNKPTPVTRRFSIGQAKKANLLTKDGTWQGYPDRMLAMRARSFAGRDTFPDLLRGIRTAEELIDIPADTTTAAPRTVQRLSDMRADVIAAPPSALTSPTDASSAASTSSGAVAGAAPDVVVFDPVTVSSVDHLLGSYQATLSNGQRIEIERLMDADAVRPFAGTDQLLHITCLRGDDDLLYLRDFHVSDLPF